MTIEHTNLLERSNTVSLVPSTVSWGQLQPGKLDIAYRVLRVGPLVISLRAINLAFHGHGQVAPNKSGVMAIESAGSASWRGSAFDDESIAIGTEVDVRTTTASTLIGVAVDHDDMQHRVPDAMDACNLAERLERNQVARGRMASARLRRAVKLLCGIPNVLPPSAGGTLLPLLATTLDDVDDHSIERSHCLNRRYAAVRTCEQYMRDHLDATVTLLDLSRACGMRSRTIINAFQAVTGFSPMDYLKRLRLSSVRGELLRADSRSTRVIDVATECGFWHMGHFARDYRAMFGEAPSQTLYHS